MVPYNYYEERVLAGRGTRERALDITGPERRFIAAEDVAGLEPSKDYPGYWLLLFEPQGGFAFTDDDGAAAIRSLPGCEWLGAE